MAKTHIDFDGMNIRNNNTGSIIQNMDNLCPKKLYAKLSLKTQKKIENQEMDANEIFRALIYEALDGTTELLSKCVGKVEHALVEKSRIERGEVMTYENKEMYIKVDALTRYALPDAGDVEDPKIDELRIHFARAIFTGAMADWMSRDSRKFPDDEMVHAGFIFACAYCETKIVKKCYGGRSKKFRKACVAQRMNLKDFTVFQNGLFEKALENHPCNVIFYALPKLAQISGQIKSGEHIEHRKCWECNKAINGPVAKVCTRCLGAQYCGSVCQEKAWKEGHRYSCLTIKKIQENHVENQKILKAALDDPEEHERRYGYKPNNRIDSMLIGIPFQCFDTKESNGNEERQLDFPSLKHFYSNLREVKKGMLWSDYPGSKPDVDSAVAIDGNDVMAASELILKGMALAYEYPPGDSLETFEDRNAMLHDRWSNGLIFHEMTFIQVPKSTFNCTAAVFLKAYETWARPQSYNRICSTRAEFISFPHMRDFDKVKGRNLLTKKTFKKFKKDMKKNKKALLDLPPEVLQNEFGMMSKELVLDQLKLEHEEKKLKNSRELLNQFEDDLNKTRKPLLDLPREVLENDTTMMRKDVLMGELKSIYMIPMIRRLSEQGGIFEELEELASKLAMPVRPYYSKVCN